MLGTGAAFGSRYHVIRLLGMGGMGAVYQAWDEELGVAVALKVIRPEITSDPTMARDLERRFKRELLLARQVTHKNVVRIHDLGEMNGIKYLTMPYIQGSDLGTILSKRGKLPVPQAISIARQVVSGLQAAHEAGVVHRDLKPANIMVDADDQAVIMDFGIARSVSGASATVAGAVVGTLEYMAPEQAMAQPVDQRADIYAFGLILYDMVLGPRQATRAESAVAELMARVQKPLTPARSVDATIPEPLERIIDRCTQPDPGSRYQTSAQLAQDLDLLDGGGRAPTASGTFSAPPVTRHVPAAGGKRSVPLVAVLAGVAVLALAVGAWMFRDSFRSGASTATPAGAGPIGLAVLPFRNATGDTSLDWLGPTVAEMVWGDVGQSARLRTVRPERVADLLRDLRVAPNTDPDAPTLKQLRDFANASTVVSGRIVKLGTQLRVEASLHGQGEDSMPIAAVAAGEGDLLAAAKSIADGIHQKLSLDESAVRELQQKAFKPSSQSVQALRHYSEGVQLARGGENLEAIKRFDQATKDDPKFALAFSRLAQSLNVLGRSTEAEQASRQAVALSASLPEEERDLIAGAHARFINDLDKAVESYERLVAARPTDAQLRYELAAMLESKGQLDRARDEFAKVLELEPKYVEALLAAGRVAIRRGDPNASIEPLTSGMTLSSVLNKREAMANIRQALGIAYRDLRRPDAALTEFQQSLTIKKEIGDRRGIAASLSEIAQIYELQGKQTDAWANYKESIAIRRAISDQRGAGNVLISLGASYLDSGRYDEALESFKEALQVQRDLGDVERQARCLSNIGNVYYAKAEYDQARTYLERALELREKGKVPGNIALTLSSLADVSTRVGEYSTAQKQYVRANDLWRGAGEKRGGAIGSFGLGTLYEQQGRFGAAVDAKSEALKTFRDLQERSYLFAEIVIGTGASLSLAGRLDDAEKTLAEGLTLSKALNNQSLIARALNGQGENAYLRGDLKAARPLFEQALQSSQKSGGRYQTLVARINLARLSGEEGRPTAVPELKKLMAEADSLGLKQLSAECSMHIGAALLAAHSRDQAAIRESLNDALTKSERLGARGLMARTHYLLGEAARAAGNASEAATHLRQAKDLLAEIQKESAGLSLTSRRDLAPILQPATQ
jgi:tetratricopeptide (TPR) repeat protein/tRNA A-37 threonylcarbamoyl transferase component Bud32